MINFFLFGKFGISPSVMIIDEDFQKKQQNGDSFDPHLVFNISSSLYQIGTELDVGKLKNFDLKTFQIISSFSKDYLLVVGVDPKFAKSKKFDDFKENIHQLHEFFLRKVTAGYSSIDFEECKSELRDLLDFVPNIKRVLKKMDLAICESD